VAKGHDEVSALGGLYVLGTERHESRRIDNQLRGRSGRQGDPGESRFYLSLQDELMRRFNSGLVERFLSAAGIPDDEPIESKMVSNAIRSAQTQVEAQNFEIRKNVLKYDDVMNRQREVIYGERRLVLEGKDIKVYLGSQYSPFIEMKNFITLDTYNPKYIQPTLDVEDYDKPYIRFGKLSNDAGDSMFGYQKLAFIFSQAISPVNVKTIDFHQSVKLPSTSGVRLFTYHDGTLYCATDGFISSKLSENPDDRQGKIFYYDSNSETWFLEDVPFERKKIFDNTGNYDILGIIRPLTSLSYKGRLFLSGHYGSIKTV
jgi:hypothetical protein